MDSLCSAARRQMAPQLFPAATQAVGAQLQATVSLHQDLVNWIKQMGMISLKDMAMWLQTPTLGCLQDTWGHLELAFAIWMDLLVVKGVERERVGKGKAKDNGKDKGKDKIQYIL